MIFGFHYFGQNDMQKAPGRIRIVTWNAHGMGIFNVPHSKPFDNRLLDFIKNIDADVLCLPEYHVPKTDVMKPFSRKIITNNQYVDFRFKDDNSLGTTIFLGTAVFSKYTFRNYVAHRLAEYTYLLQGDVDLPGGQTIRMFFVHLSTFGFSDDDKAYIDYVKKHSSFRGKALGYSRSFLWKFNYAFARRASEVDKAASIIAQSPYPIVLCGDFNDLPGSYTYTKLRGNLSDAFLEKGRGFGRTYNEIIPTLRIDHMFYDPKVLKPVGYSSEFTSLSDHNPVIVNFEIIPMAAN
jgi:endonuclease/exonuclease/phosphatase family metal-dependent hydrolase